MKRSLRRFRLVCLPSQCLKGAVVKVAVHHLQSICTALINGESSLPHGSSWLVGHWSNTRGLRAKQCAHMAITPAWVEALGAYLAIVLDKTLDYNSTVCTWHNSREIIGHTFARFALPITWDFTELVHHE